MISYSSRFVPAALPAFAAVALGGAIAVGNRYGWLVAGAILGGALLFLAEGLGVRMLQIWLVLTGVAFPFVRVPTAHPYVTFDRVWILASLATVVGSSRRLPRSGATRSVGASLLVFVVLFGGRALITISHVSHYSAVQLWVDAILMPALLFLVVERLVADDEDAVCLGFAFTLGGVVLACIGIAEWLFHFELASRSGAAVAFDHAVDLVRISGPYSYPEEFSLALAISLAMSFFWLLSRQRRAYAFGALAIGLQGFALALTLFRSAWIAGLLVIIAVVGVRRRGTSRFPLVALVFLSAAYLGFGQLQSNSVFQRRTEGTVALGNIDSRLATYWQASDLIRRNPLFGIGVDRYTAVATPLQPKVVRGWPSLPYPHNSFLGLLAEQGIVGFIPFLVFAFAAVNAIRALRRRARTHIDILLAAAAIGSGLAYLFVSMTLDVLPEPPANLLMSVVLGAVCGRLNGIESKSGAKSGQDRRAWAVPVG